MLFFSKINAEVSFFSYLLVVVFVHLIWLVNEYVTNHLLNYTGMDHFAMPLEQVNVYYNDYFHNIIITYFIICHNMSKDWIQCISLCQYNWYFYICHFLVWHIMSTWVWWTPCSYCNANIHVTPLCAHSMGSLDSLQSILWSPGVKISWLHGPTSWFVARYFKESWVPHGFV